jgi:hypothetical protein
LTVPSGSLSSCRIGRDRADLIEILRGGIVDVRLFLRQQQDLLVDLHRLLERKNRLLATDEQRNHHVRVDDDVAERQHRQWVVGRSRGRRRFVFGGQIGTLRCWTRTAAESDAGSDLTGWWIRTSL